MQMGSCRDLHSGLCSSRYISWCVESAKPQTPENMSQAAPETNTTFSHQRVQSDTLHHADPATVASDDRQQGRKPESSNYSGQESSPLLPGDKSFHLPRSSPVISRRHRPVSWHGGGTDGSDPTSLDSSPTAQASPSQNLHSCLEEPGPKPSSCFRPPPFQADKKPRTLSSNLNNLLLSLLHLPFSGLPARPEEHRGQVGSGDRHSADGQERRSSGGPAGSADIFRTSCELDEENAHFIVVDMVLEVLEGVKWNLSADNVRRRPDRGHVQEEAKRESGHQPKTFSVLSTDSGFEDCPGDVLTQKACVTDAESLAQQLVVEFRRSWLPRGEPRRGRLSLRSSLQELPGSGSVALSSSSLTEEIQLRTRMRGSVIWTPPSFQIIFSVQPALRRSQVVTLQNFLCAGCGTKVEPKHIRKLQYCEYLGRYFCDCCHSGAEALIPARVLSTWDFGRYPVSDFSKQLLDSVKYQPLFDLNSVGKTLYSRVKELHKFRELQDRLLCIQKLLKACRLSDSVKAELEQLPAHLMERPHLFSMDDLLRLKQGELAARARAALHAGISHVETCQLCLARGFICEFCRSRDVIFAFQKDVCQRCTACKTCFHKNCFAGKTCPKCARIRTRNKRPDETENN